jgi:hypothetical protein
MKPVKKDPPKFDPKKLTHEQLRKIKSSAQPAKGNVKPLYPSLADYLPSKKPGPSLYPLVNPVSKSNKKAAASQENIDFVKNVSIETGIDQLPYGNTIMGAKALNEGRPLTALSEFAKVPIGWVGDAAVNAAQENPTNYSIGKLEDKIIPAARLAAGSVTRLATGETPIITEIGKQIMTSGEKPDSKWYARNFNLPTVYEAAKMYGVDNNTFTKFVEDNWENSGKSYKKVIELAELKLRNKKK